VSQAGYGPDGIACKMQQK